MKLSDTSLIAALTQLRDGLVNLLPSLATSLIVLLLGWLLALSLRAVVRRGVAGLARRMPVGPTRAAWDESVGAPGAGRAAANGVYWLVLLLTIVVAIEALGMPLMTEWLAAVTGYLPNVIVAVALVFAGVVGGRLAGNAILKTVTRMSPQQARNLARLTHTAIVIASVLIAASQLGIDVSLLTAVFLIMLAATLGGAALAFGLGARDVIGDILAMHYINKTYRVGQVVRVGDDHGKIVRATATAVFLETAEGEVCISGRDFRESRSATLNHGEHHGA